jgi:hypothetical protein
VKTELLIKTEVLIKGYNCFKLSKISTNTDVLRIKEGIRFDSKAKERRARQVIAPLLRRNSDHFINRSPNPQILFSSSQQKSDSVPLNQKYCNAGDERYRLDLRSRSYFLQRFQQKGRLKQRYVH